MSNNLDNFYSSGEFLKRNPDSYDEAEWKLKFINCFLSKVVISEYKIADFGSGQMHISKNLAKQHVNIDFFAYDIIPKDLIDVSGLSINLQYVHSNYYPSDNYFDLTLAIDVLEHISSPIETLIKMSDCSNYVLIHIPLDISFLSLLRTKVFEKLKTTVGHINFYSTNTAKIMIDAAELEIVESCYTDAYKSFPLNRKLSVKFMTFVRNIFSIIFSKKLSADVFGGQTMFILARKKNVNHDGHF